MKTQKLYFLTIFALFLISDLKAQVTQAINGISSTSYVGTSNNFDVVFKRQAVNAGLLSLNKTSFGLNSVAMDNSVSFGVGAGQFSSGLGGNTYIGQNAGKGSVNFPNSGTQNVFIGAFSGINNGSGYGNTYIGTSAGSGNNSGNNNIFIGNRAGANNWNGYGNTFIGAYSGSEEGHVGSRNVFIGHSAGFTLAEPNDKLVIGNDESVQLIWGDFALNQLKLNGRVGIGFNFGNYPTTAGSVDVSGYNLFVRGGILTEEVRVMLQTDWADYVFSKDYKLASLSDVEQFIHINGHLPNVPSAQKVKEDGIELGEMAKIQQEKIEELTLYVIQLNKEIENLKTAVQVLMEKK